MSTPRADVRRGPVPRGIMRAAVAAVGFGMAGYLVGQHQATGRVTELTIAPCGLGAAPAPVALPLNDLLRKAGGHGLSLGPFRHDGLDRAVTVRFALDAEGPVRHRDGDGHDLVVVPVPTSARELPDEIRLECRYGTVARVQYRTGQTREAFDVPSAPAQAGSGTG